MYNDAVLDSSKYEHILTEGIHNNIFWNDYNRLLMTQQYIQYCFKLKMALFFSSSVALRMLEIIGSIYNHLIIGI